MGGGGCTTRWMCRTTLWCGCGGGGGGTGIGGVSGCGGVGTGGVGFGGGGFATGCGAGGIICSFTTAGAAGGGGIGRVATNMIAAISIAAATKNARPNRSGSDAILLSIGRYALVITQKLNVTLP